MSKMRAFSGKIIDVANPDPELITIEDIAHALSNLCRFNGHISRQYSVAQHSVLVSKLLPDEFKLAGLLHDATEAYMGDVPTPIKKLLPEYQKMEDNLYAVIARKFGIPEVIPPEVHYADKQALKIEYIAIVGGKENDPDFEFLSNYEITDQHLQEAKSSAMTNDVAKNAFLTQFRMLTTKPKRKLSM